MTRRIVTKITKISTPRKLPAIRYVKKNATLIKNLCHFLIRNVPHFMVCLWICAGSVLPRFLPNAPIFAKRTAIWRNALHFHGLWRFTRRCTFRNSVKVRHTQRDKRGTRYTALISVAAARLLPSFRRIPYPCSSISFLLYVCTVYPCSSI